MSKPIIAFGVMCSTEATPAVRQLLSTLGDQQPIFVHHDHRKSPRFAVNQSNVQFVPDPLDTGWGTWEFVQAIVKTMQVALDRSNFEYFQVLSGSCLPIKPISAFEQFVVNRSHDVHMGLINMDESGDTMMSHGHRVFAQNKSLRYRLLLRARKLYLAGETVTTQQSGLGIIHLTETARNAMPLSARLALSFTAMARRGGLFSHPFHEGVTPYIGSTWFGCSRAVCEFLVSRSPDEVLEKYYRKTKLIDESYFHTLIGNSKFSIGPSNHLISDFIESHPRLIEPAELVRLKQSSSFFARKFKMALDDPARQGVLELCHDLEPATHSESTRTL